MIRVVAVGNGAGNIVDQLKKNKTYPEVEFVYCDTNVEMLNAHGVETDKHVLLTPDMEKVRADLHSAHDIATVLVCCLGGKTTSKYALDIAHELRNYSGKTYFFATIPLVIEGALRRANALNTYDDIAGLCNVSVLQDNEMIPEYLNFSQMDNGIVIMIESLLSSPSKDLNVDKEELPFIALATAGQGIDALVALSENNPQFVDYNKMRTFKYQWNGEK